MADKHSLIGFTYGHPSMSREDWFEIISHQLTELVNRHRREFPVLVHPVFIQNKVLGFAVTKVDPDINEYVLIDWLREELGEDKGEYETDLEFDLDIQETHEFAYPLTTDEDKK